MIYLDHHAATPLSAAVHDAMRGAQRVAWANPASVHRAGQAARAALEQARSHVATSIAAQPADVVFAGPGTEACNLALLGVARARLQAGHRHVIVGPLEHPAVAESARALAREGAELVSLAVTGTAIPGDAAFEALLTDDVACVTVQWVNHETGSVFPIAAYARACAARGVPFIVDGSQALGKLPLSVREVPLSALVLASAKVGGPPGVSAVWHERCGGLSPVMHGGAQERGLRPGTPDVVAAVGFGAAARDVPQRLAEMPRIAALRDRLEATLVELGGVINGVEGPRVATVTNASFQGRRGDVLVAALDVEGVCVSAGAACSSGLAAPSPVLRALYPTEPWRASAAVRFSLGPETTDADVDAAVAALRRVFARTRR